jgi:hypothetical protein
MHRLTVLAMSLLLATSSFAGQIEPQPAGTAPGTAPAAAADKVYPPLPSLAMLPPPTSQDDEQPSKSTWRKKIWRAHERKSAGPTARLIVSDASHTYLDTVERQLDQALLK